MLTSPPCCSSRRIPRAWRSSASTRMCPTGSAPATPDPSPSPTRRKEAPGMRPHPPWLSRQYLAVSAAAVLSACLVAACSSSSSTTGATKATSSPTNTKPIVIGASLSLTGDFSADGQAFERGYKLWQTDINRTGGLLGRQVKFIFVDDKSDPTQGSTNVQQLITTNH